MSYKNISKILSLIILSYLAFNAFKIYQFSKLNTQEKAKVAIVLGAGTNNGKPTAVFKERIKHSIKLYQENRIEKIIFTGGFGKGETISDSQAAKNYAIKNNVPKEAILIEEKSKYTIENLAEAKSIMDSLKFESALLVSDPLHMKRSISLAQKMKITCFSSPTETSMFKSRKTKLQFLIYETFYFTLGKISGRN